MLQHNTSGGHSEKCDAGRSLSNSLCDGMSLTFHCQTGEVHRAPKFRHWGRREATTSPAHGQPRCLEAGEQWGTIPYQWADE